MRNPILQTIGNLQDNTGSLLNMLSKVNTKVTMPTRNNRVSLLRTLQQDSTAKLPTGNTNSAVDTLNSSNPSVSNKYGVSDKLWSVVSPLIDAYGLSVIEGYRDPATASSKSAKNSQHYSGNALDLNYSSLSPQRRRELLKKARGLGLSTGVGRNTLHVDTRPGKYWFYDDSGNWTTDTRYMPEWSQGIFR